MLVRGNQCASTDWRTIGGALTTEEVKLHVAGGCRISVEDEALHCYDPTANQWEFKPPVNKPCILLAVMSASGRIYVLGDCTDYVDHWFDVLAVEYYVSKTNEWTTVSPMWVAQFKAGCCLLEKKIYIVGISWYLSNVMSIVQVYNTEMNEWERDLHCPESLAGITWAPVILS